MYENMNEFLFEFLYEFMYEPLYEFLLKQIGEKRITFYKYNELPTLNEFGNKGETQLLVCDDLIANKKQDKLEDYSIRCRKFGKGISLMYLSQKYYSVPIIIRAKAQYLIIIKVSDQQDLKRMHEPLQPQNSLARKQSEHSYLDLKIK